MRRSLYNRIKSQRRPLRREQMTIKDGDIIVQYVPMNEYGETLVSRDVVRIYHKTLKNLFPNNTVITTPLEIEVISKVDVELKIGVLINEGALHPPLFLGVKQAYDFSP